MLGSVVRSEAGKEAGNYYVILKVEDEYVYLADGRRLKTGNPKKKKLKHIAPTGYTDEALSSKLVSGREVTNKEVRRAKSDYLKQIDNN